MLAPPRGVSSPTLGKSWIRHWRRHQKSETGVSVAPIMAENIIILTPINGLIISNRDQLFLNVSDFRFRLMPGAAMAEWLRRWT